MTDTELVNLLTIASIFTAGGGALDKITSKQRNLRPLSFSNASYFDVVFLFYHGFYDKVLKGPAFSIGYAIRSLVVATSLGTVVIIFYSVYVPIDLSSVAASSLYSYLFFVPAAIFYYFTFWLISAQTKLFIEESMNTRSRLSRFVFIGSDILTSSNIFVFVFALGLSTSANIFLSYVIQPHLRASELGLEVEIKKTQGAVVSENEVPYLYVVEVHHLLDGERSINPVGSNRYTIASVERFFAPDFFLPQMYPQLGSFSLYSSEDTNISGKELISLVEGSSRVSYGAKHEFIYPDFSYGTYYPFAYNVVDTVEDNFWNLLDPSIAFLHANRLFKLYGGYTPFDVEALCERDGRLISGVSVSTDDSAINCSIKDVVLSGSSSSNLNHIHFSVYRLLDFYIPVAPLFIATMLFSLLFYAAVLISYFFLFVKRVPVIKTVFSTAYEILPFSTGGLLLGFLAWALTV